MRFDSEGYGNNLSRNKEEDLNKEIERHAQERVEGAEHSLLVQVKALQHDQALHRQQVQDMSGHLDKRLTTEKQAHEQAQTAIAAVCENATVA